MISTKRMIGRAMFVALLPALMLNCGACHKVVDPPAVRIVVDEIATSELTSGLDSAYAYSYRFPAANPDSLLRLLVDRGIPVARGWEAIDYLCMDPMGPRFTIELARDDARVTAYDFERGVGRLWCSTRLRRYTVQ
jgi:hypothetical protein